MKAASRWDNNALRWSERSPEQKLQIFYRNDINVPFPNITVSQLDVSNRKTMEDLEKVKPHSEPKQE